MVLSVSEVEFAYRPPPRGRGVLRGVSAAFAAGRVTGVVGPNGAGKSTLLRLLLGVLRPVRGRVELATGAGREEVGGMPARRRAAHLAYIPQQAQVAEAFTAGQVVRLGRLSRPRDEGAVQAALERAQVGECRDELFGALSAGQQQRVILARALAQLGGSGPPPGEQAIIADEPCAAMDPKHMVRAMELLREEAARGRAVVVVLHDLTTALRFVDEALVLDAQGRVAALGPAAEVLAPASLERVFGIPFVRIGGAGAGEPVAVIPDGGARYS